MEEYPWLLFFPGLVLTLTLFSLNFLGDGLRDALDPRFVATVDTIGRALRRAGHIGAHAVERERHLAAFGRELHGVGDEVVEDLPDARGIAAVDAPGALDVAVVVLMVGLLRSRAARHGVVPLLTIGFFVASLGLAIWQWDERGTLMSEALALDPLYLFGAVGVAVAGVMAVFLSFGAAAPRETAHGEYHALLLVAGAGMVLFAGAQNLITAFIGLELLSVPLYVLAASELYRRRSLEAGMKYLVVGSVGSATLLYGFAMIFGATGTTDYTGIAAAIADENLGSDPLLLAGVAFAIVGLAFKASVAPFHQWTPDVYEGAPTPVTAFMAVATKAAAAYAFSSSVAASASVREESNTAPRTTGQGAPAASNHAVHSSVR